MTTRVLLLHLSRSLVGQPNMVRSILVMMIQMTIPSQYMLQCVLFSIYIGLLRFHWPPPTTLFTCYMSPIIN